MKITAEQAADIAQKLVALMNAITTLSIMLKEVKEQREGQEQAVWDRVSADFDQSVSAFKASIK